MKKILISFALIIGTVTAASAQKSAKAPEFELNGTIITTQKSTLKVVTSDEFLFQSFIKTHATLIKKYSVDFKKDRQGVYKQYTIPFDVELLPEIEEYITEVSHIKK